MRTRNAFFAASLIAASLMNLALAQGVDASAKAGSSASAGAATKAESTSAKKSAAEKSCPDTAAPAEQISCLKAVAATLRERIAVKELESRLSSPIKSFPSIGDSLPNLGRLGEMLGETPFLSTEEDDIPVVHATYGSGNSLQAGLYWPKKGGSLVVSQGDVIPGGYVVTSIQPGRVVIEHNGQNRVLLLGSKPQSSVAPKTQGLMSTTGAYQPQQMPPAPSAANK